MNHFQLYCVLLAIATQCMGCANSQKNHFDWEKDNQDEQAYLLDEKECDSEAENFAGERKWSKYVAPNDPLGHGVNESGARYETEKQKEAWVKKYRLSIEKCMTLKGYIDHSKSETVVND